MFRFLAQFVSIIGHPLFVVTWALLVLLTIDPFAFGVPSIDSPNAKRLILAVVINTVFIPLVGISLMKGLGFVRSFQMEDKQERTGPYIMTGVFYLWAFKNLLSVGHTPRIFTACVLGATIALFVAFFANIFTKISAHAAGMGGFLTMILIMVFEKGASNPLIELGPFQWSVLFIPVKVFLLAGAVGTARLYLNAHTPADLWRGYAAGVASVLAAYAIV